MPQGAEVATVDVLVARTLIPAGTQITEAMLDRQPWPKNLVLDGFVLNNDPGIDIIGKITRATFQPQEPVLVTKLANIDDAGFLAGALPRGMRAITIKIDAITGVAGYVFPGDRIDLVFTHSIPEQGSKSAPKAPSLGGLGSMMGSLGGAMGGSGASVAEVLAANVPVLAVNVREDADLGGGNLAGNLMATVAGGGGAPSSLTLQVNDKQAQQIRLAESVGTLSVSLRSVKDRHNNAAPEPTQISNITRVSPGTQIEITSDEVRVIRGIQNSATAPAPVMPGYMNMMMQR